VYGHFIRNVGWVPSDQCLAAVHSASDLLESGCHLRTFYSINDENGRSFFCKSLCDSKSNSLGSASHQDLFRFDSF
jgi:hypothetical protein